MALSEEQKNIISKKKLDLIRANVANLTETIETLVKFRPEQYSIKQVEWKEKLKDVSRVVEDKSYFLFIGRFSAGKSSFINALLGIDMLPTAAQPCTAVVTEVSFADGTPRRVGKIVYSSGNVEEIDRVELLDIIKGKLQKETGAIHHVELEVDINEFGENKDSFRSFVGKVILVDCPGFDSPYRFAENILYEYVEKASFTFYLMPANDFGGMNEIMRLNKLRQKTTTLVPLISKADLITDGEEREDITERFVQILSGNFKNQEAIFISTFKYLDYVKKNKDCQEKRLTGQMTTEDSNELNSLLQASGINKVFAEMSRNSAESELNNKKLDQILFQFNELVDDLRKATLVERNFLRSELERIGFDIDSKNYKDIERFEDAMSKYIDSQAETVGTELKNNIVVEISSMLNSSNRPDESAINQVFYEEFRKITEKYNSIWEERFNTYFTDLSGKLQIENPEFNAPRFRFPLPGSYIPAGIIAGICKSGAGSIFLALSGATLIGSQAAIAGIALVGGILAPIAVFGGIALLGYVGLKNINPIKDGIMDQKEKSDRSFHNEIAKVLDSNQMLNFKDVIAKSLLSYKKAISEAVTNKRSAITQMVESNYRESKDMIDRLEVLQNNMNNMVN